MWYSNGSGPMPFAQTSEERLGRGCEMKDEVLDALAHSLIEESARKEIEARRAQRNLRKR